MSLRQLGGALTALGALAWIVRWIWVEDPTLLDVTRWLGLAVVLGGLVCVGLTLVNGSALWLDVVVGAAAPLLFWAVYESVRTGFDSDVTLHGLLGVLVLAAGVGTTVRGGLPRVPDEAVEGPGHRAGSQASHRA